MLEFRFRKQDCFKKEFRKKKSWLAINKGSGENVAVEISLLPNTC